MTESSKASRTTDDLAAAAPAADASLTDVQEWMAGLITHRRGLPKCESMRKAAALHFTGNDRLSPAEQIDIYRQQFWLRHTSVLIEDFPGVTALLGQKAWEPIAERFLTERALGVFSLRDLGMRLPEYLTELADLPGRQLLVDMARLECAYLEAFDAENDPTLSALKVSQIAPEAWQEARIQISHSLRLLDLQYAVADLRRTLKNNKSRPDAAQVPREPHYLVVYRRDYGLFDKRVSRVAYLLLRSLLEGKALIPACEAVVELEPSAADVFDEQLMEWFALWGRLGWITDVHV